MARSASQSHLFSSSLSFGGLQMICWSLGTPHLFSFSSTNKNYLIGSILQPSNCFGNNFKSFFVKIPGVVMSYNQDTKLFLITWVCVTSANSLSIPGVISKTSFFLWEKDAESLSAIFGSKATGRSATSIRGWTLLLPWHSSSVSARASLNSLSLERLLSNES